ncbi:MAG: hypothetical protein ACRDKA_15580, partial [Actinomycetota bacterium]
MSLRSSVLVVALVTLALTAAPVTLPRGSEGGFGQTPPCSEGVGASPSTAEVAASAGQPVLANFWIQKSDTNELRWADPVTLRPISDRIVPLGNQNGAPHVFSPNRSRLAIGALSRFHLVDVEAMERVWSV